MLWYKSWLETRWRFAIGLAILILSAVGTVLAYPRVVKLLPLVPSVVDSGEVGRRLLEIAALSRTYRGYVWAQWLRQNMTQMLALFAALLGTGGLLSQSSGGGAFFTLSLPVSRDRLLGVRAATGLAELFALAFIPSLVLPLLSPPSASLSAAWTCWPTAPARSSRRRCCSAWPACSRRSLATSGGPCSSSACSPPVSGSSNRFSATTRATDCSG